MHHSDAEWLVERPKEKHTKHRHKPHTQYKKIKKSRRTKQRLNAYKGYMDSLQWYRRRRRYLKQVGAFCRACGSTYIVTVHHMTYANIGNEPDRDLVALCKHCHVQYHERANRTNRKTTMTFIRRKAMDTAHKRLIALTTRTEDAGVQQELQSIISIIEHAQESNKKDGQEDGGTKEQGEKSVPEQEGARHD